MGDRANIVMHYDQGGEIYFYTHWAGTELAETLKAALLRGQSRWDDAPYLARIIFCEMVKADVEGETGYGISPYETDNEHPLIHVDTEKLTVRIGSGKAKGFAEFCGE